MDPTIKFMNSSMSSHIYLFGGGGGIRTLTFYSQQVLIIRCGVITIVARFHLRSSDLIHAIAASLSFSPTSSWLPQTL